MKKNNFDLDIIYKEKLDENDPEMMKKLRYNIPTNIVDIELDTPDLKFDSKDCPNCGSKKSFKKIPIGESFVKGLIGSFLIKTSNTQNTFGKMFRNKVSELNFIYACDKCTYAEQEYDDFKPEIER